MATHQKTGNEEREQKNNRGSQQEGGSHHDNNRNRQESQNHSNNSHGSHRGFAAMNDEQQREIASKGGKAVSKDREHMAEIGRKGGEH
ncbi:MAG: KGG domain-containing protein [Mucilaginibacter sp.]